MSVQTKFSLSKPKCSATKINTCKELVKVSSKKIIREPKTDGYYLDLCKNGLSVFPDGYLDNHRLGLLYLEGNEITELPEEIFTCFPNLKWLDIRNNRIVQIPPTIKFHENLETFLLQNNKIAQLPMELGTLPNIKNVQIMPNPVTFPPIEVIHKGTSAVIYFLHEEFKKCNPAYLKHVVQLELIKTMTEELNKPEPIPKPSNTDLLNKQLQDLKYYLPTDKKKSQYLTRLNEISFDVCSPLEVKKYVNPYKKIYAKNIFKTGNQKDKDDEESGNIENGRLNLPLRKAPFVGKAFSNKRRTKLSTVLKKLLDSLKEARLKDKLGIIEDILELRRNIANQEKFKYEYKYRSRISCLKKAHKKTTKPYGTHEEYEKMLSRWELQYFKNNPTKKTKHVRRRFRTNKIDINEQIRYLLKSLDKITLNKAEENDETTDPVLEKKKLTMEIAKISEIQKSLKKLQLHNSNNI